jgi:hypothetical protein
MFSILKGFLPWILYSIFYGSSPKKFIIALLIALVSSVVFEWQSLKDKFILSWTTLIYFSLLLMVTLIFHWEWLQINIWLVSNFILAAMAFGSSCIGKPFTIQYAKKIASEDKWNHPLFVQINYILTNIWGLIFLLTGIVNYIYVAHPLALLPTTF